MYWRLKRFVYNKAYPVYKCEDCIGMIHYGCECVYLGASAPGTGPTKWHLFLRWLHEMMDKL